MSTWSQRLKGVSGLLGYLILHQSDPILLHNRPKSRFNLQGTVRSKVTPATLLHRNQKASKLKSK